MPHALNLRHLRIFREVARGGSVSLAAARQNVSQPAVTQAMAKLSRQVGVRLLDRRSDGMHLTEAGDSFLIRVDRALQHLRAGGQEAMRLGQRIGNRGFPQFHRLLTMAQIRALVTTAEVRNFSMAARQIGISQPSVHRAARGLEQLSGLTLFRSAPEGISLTPAAQELARRARLALAELRQGLDHIASQAGRDSSFIAIGSLPLARTSILPTAIAHLMAERQGVRAQVFDGAYEQLLARLRQGDLDFMVGALRFPPPAGDIRQEVLFDDPLALVVGAGHPLLSRSSPTLAEALDYPWVAPPPSTPAGGHLVAMLDEAGLSPSAIRVISSSLVFVRGMLASGPYVSIISTHQARYEIEAGLFRPLPIPLPSSTRSIGLTVRAEWLPTPTQQLCIELVRRAARLEYGGENGAGRG